MQISVHVLTKNSELSLKETLESLQTFPEVILTDTGSTDTTLDIAREFPNVKINQKTLEGFGPIRNAAAQLASYDWILSVDSDEVLTHELTHELRTLSLDPRAVYAIHRNNYYKHKQIYGCAGWYPDWVIRLYNRNTTAFSDALVHEKILTPGLKVIRLRHPLKHTPYRSINDFLLKMHTYTSFFALQHQGKKRSSFPRALFYSWAAFFKSYILKRGVFGGKTGFIISLYNAQTTYYKYLKLAEANEKIRT